MNTKKSAQGFVSGVFRKPSKNISLPQEVKVRGYAVRRMPIGAYVKAIESLNTQKITNDLLAALFPGMDANAIFKYLKTIDTAKLGDLVMRAFAVVPKYVAILLSGLTGISEDSLMDDPAIGLDGLMELIAAWIEVNNIENFMTAARRLIGKIVTQAASSGSKG